jgi:hypothetical protein
MKGIGNEQGQRASILSIEVDLQQGFERVKE